MSTTAPGYGQKNRNLTAWFNVSVMSLSHFTSDFYCNVLPVMLPILALRFNISYSESAALLMLFSVTSSVLQPIVGIAADKKQINFLMPLSIITGGFFVCAVGMLDHLWTIALVILISGLCTTFFHPISAGVVNDISPKERKGLATSIYIAGGNFGFAIAPLIVAAFLDYFSDRDLLLLALPSLLVVFLIVKQGLHKPLKREVQVSADLSFIEMIKSWPFICLNLSIALRSWTYCAFVVFLPLLLTGMGLSTVDSATALVALLCGTVVGGLSAGSLSDILPVRTVIASTYVVSVLGAGYFLTHPGTSPDALIALFVTGAGMYGSTPAAIVWAQQMMGRHAAFAASMMLGLTFGLGYMESVITGFVGDCCGLREGLIYTTIPAMIGAIILILMIKSPPREKNR